MIRALTSSLVLFAVLLSLGCDAKPEGVLNLELIASDERGTYRAQNNGEGVSPVLGEGVGVAYALHTMYRMDSFEFNGEGSFEKAQGKEQQPTEHKPGESTEGVDILYYFYKATDGRYIIRQIVKGMTLEGEIDVDIMAEVEFTKGSWDDFRSGKTVNVTFTEEGLDEYYTVAEEQAEKLIQMMADAQSPNLRTEFEFEWMSKPNALFVVSLQELAYEMQGDGHLKMTMKAYEK